MEIAELMNTTREQRLSEVGREVPCPFCGKPRVRRSSYIRCYPCGMNWGFEDDLGAHPHMRATPSTKTEPDTGAPTAR